MSRPETMEELRSLIHDEIVEETCSNNIIAINYSNNQLGVAGYEELQNTIYGEVFEVSLDDCETTLLSIKNFFNPGLFLVHPSILANTSLLKFILQGTDGTPDFYSYKTLRTSAWNEMMTTNILYNDLKIRTSQGGRVVQESAFETIRRLQIDLDLEKIRLKQVLGALLTYLQDAVFKLDKGKIVVSAIKEFPVVAYMRMDTNSFRALQIFSEDFHPNWISGKGRSKEGFSIFGLFDRTHSILGRRKLREWMSKPFADMDKIVQRQNFISFTLDELNKDLLSQITFNLKNIFDIPRILVRIKKVEANYGDWCKLYSSLTNSISILDKFEAHKSFSYLDAENVHFINELSRNLNIYVLRNLAKLLASVIDFHSTLEAKRIQIHEGFDRVLDQKREIYGSIESLLFEAGQKVIDSFSFLEKVTVVFIDQVGYLLALSRDDSNQLAHYGLIENPPDTLTADKPTGYNIIGEKFTWIFNQEETSYFKNDIMREMDKSIGDIKSDILDQENIILINLEDQLLEFEYDLLQLGVSMSNLDAYISLGEIALQFKLVKPQIVSDNSIVIKNGRHLLQELSVEAFVPNDAYLTNEKCIAVISGHNGSGKSVYLKQVGLIIYLAHIGSFVPCEKAAIGLTTRIFTRISSEESVSDPHSAFSLDLNQMSRMLNHHAPRSVCLIDEFGKGTSPVDGMSLLAGVVKFFAQHSVLSMFALHFTEIFENSMFPIEIQQKINCFRMDALAEAEDDHVENLGIDALKLIPLFKLKYGLSRSSYGISCARDMGVPKKVLIRAQEIKASIRNKLPLAPIHSLLPLNIQLSTDEKELLRNILQK